MSIKEYISETEAKKRYKLRIKTVVPLDDESIAKIENVIAKYHPIEVEKATKTILQKNPLDFGNVSNSEVWIIDVVFAMPASPVDVKEEIRRALDAPESYVVVRNRNEPMEVETARLNAVADIDKEAAERGLTPASLFSIDPEYHEYEEVDPDTLAGNKYNTVFLSYLAQVQQERPDMRVSLPKDSTLFDWLKMPDSKDQEPYQSPENFNKDIKDAPVVSPKSKIKFETPSVMGDIDDQKKVVRKVYTDKKGKKVVLSRQYGDEE